MATRVWLKIYGPLRPMTGNRPELPFGIEFLGGSYRPEADRQDMRKRTFNVG